MNKKELFKKIFLVSASLISLVISLILYIKSYEFYSDEYGTDISFNEDYSVAVIVSLVIFGYLMYTLIKYIKKEEAVYFNDFIGLASTAIVSFYSLGKFFKNLFKAIQKGKEFAFQSYQAYLFIGLVVLMIFIYFVIIVVENRLKKQNS